MYVSIYSRVSMGAKEWYNKKVLKLEMAGGKRRGER